MLARGWVRTPSFLQAPCGLLRVCCGGGVPTLVGLVGAAERSRAPALIKPGQHWQGKHTDDDVRPPLSGLLLPTTLWWPSFWVEGHGRCNGGSWPD